MGSHHDLEDDDDEYNEEDASRLSFFCVPDYFRLGEPADYDVTAAARPPRSGIGTGPPQDGEYFEQRLSELTRMALSPGVAKESSPPPAPQVGKQDTVEQQSEAVRTCDLSVEAAAAAEGTAASPAAEQQQQQLFTDPRYHVATGSSKLTTFRSRQHCGEEERAGEFRKLPLQGSGAAGVKAADANPPIHFSNSTAVQLQKVDNDSPPPPQFLLPPSPPHQPRTCPDGSSNPDIDLVPLPKRSPGSGKSSQSDPEEEEVIASSRRPAIHMIADDGEAVIKKKEVSSFAALLSRLFGNPGSGQSKKSQKKAAGSKRSKSCDKELESSATVRGSAKNVKSASASPLKTSNVNRQQQQQKLSKSTTASQQAAAVVQQQQQRATTPSTLSLDTEWEFQAQERQQQQQAQQPPHHQDDDDDDEDDDNGNNVWLAQGQLPYSSLQLGGGENRKSSGYDSLESCSLDSMDNGNHNSCPPAYYYDNRLLLGQQQQQQQQLYGTYAVPELWINNSGCDGNNSYKEMDEVAMLKLEIGRHPDILNKNY